MKFYCRRVVSVVNVTKDFVTVVETLPLSHIFAGLMMTN